MRLLSHAGAHTKHRTYSAKAPKDVTNANERFRIRHMKWLGPALPETDQEASTPDNISLSGSVETRDMASLCSMSYKGRKAMLALV